MSVLTTVETRFATFSFKKCEFNFLNAPYKYYTGSNIMKDHMAKFDENNDGKFSEKEFELYQQNEKLKATLDKQDSQRQMAWTAILVIIVATALLFMPIIPAERLETIIPMLDWFYISMASIVGAFMGMTAWMSKK